MHSELILYLHEACISYYLFRVDGFTLNGHNFMGTSFASLLNGNSAQKGRDLHLQEVLSITKEETLFWMDNVAHENKLEVTIVASLCKMAENTDLRPYNLRFYISISNKS